MQMLRDFIVSFPNGYSVGVEARTFREAAVIAGHAGETVVVVNPATLRICRFQVSEDGQNAK